MECFNSHCVKMSPSIDAKPTSGDVWKSYVVKMDSIKSLYIQETSNFNRFQKLCSEVTTRDLVTTTTCYKVGDIGAARDEHGIWHRAKVQAKSKLGLKVCFIDLNIKGIVPTDFKNLPTEFITKESIYYCCVLKYLPIEDKMKLLNSDFFYVINKYVTSNEMTVKFLNATHPYSIELSLNGTNILNVISKLIWNGIVPSSIDDPIDIAKLNMLNKLTTCHKPVAIRVDPIISFNNFYIETESSHEVDKKIRTEIDGEKNWKPILHPKEGDIVIAKNAQDNLLYRARVTLNYEGCGMCKCFFIDCGTFVLCSEFFEPSDYLQTAPPAKIHCSLIVDKKIQPGLIENITLSFIDELKVNCDKSITFDMIKVGSPCKIDLEIDHKRMSMLLRPHKVKIIHIKNINSFKAQLICSAMVKIQHVLEKMKKFRTVTNPEALKLYAAKFDENQYERVQYFGTYGPGHEVFKLDEKYERKFVPELFKLPKSIENIKSNDIYGSLELNTNDYSNNKFIDICNDGKTTFLMIVTKTDFINGHTVKLYLNLRDVETLIRN